MEVHADGRTAGKSTYTAIPQPRPTLGLSELLDKRKAHFYSVQIIAVLVGFGFFFFSFLFVNWTGT